MEIEKKIGHGKRGEAAPKSHCPKCGAAAKYHETKRLTKITKELFFQCTNFECSIRFVDQQTTIRIIGNKIIPQGQLPIIAHEEEFKALKAA